MQGQENMHTEKQDLQYYFLLKTMCQEGSIVAFGWINKNSSVNLKIIDAIVNKRTFQMFLDVVVLLVRYRHQLMNG